MSKVLERLAQFLGKTDDQTFNWTPAMGVVQQTVYTAPSSPARIRNILGILFDMTNVQGDANTPNVAFEVEIQKSDLSWVSIHGLDATWNNANKPGFFLSLIPYRYGLRVKATMSIALNAGQAMDIHPIIEER